jgi:hypothetical protein
VTTTRSEDRTTAGGGDDDVLTGPVEKLFCRPFLGLSSLTTVDDFVSFQRVGHDVSAYLYGKSRVTLSDGGERTYKRRCSERYRYNNTLAGRRRNH